MSTRINGAFKTITRLSFIFIENSPTKWFSLFKHEWISYGKGYDNFSKRDVTEHGIKSDNNCYRVLFFRSPLRRGFVRRHVVRNSGVGPSCKTTAAACGTAASRGPWVEPAKINTSTWFAMRTYEWINPKSPIAHPSRLVMRECEIMITQWLATEFDSINSRYNMVVDFIKYLFKIRCSAFHYFFRKKEMSRICSRT